MYISIYIHIYIATHCNTQQRARYVCAKDIGFWEIVIDILVVVLQHTAAHCNTLQHTASHCITLHHTASHCNIAIVVPVVFVTALHFFYLANNRPICVSQTHTHTHGDITQSYV